MKTRPKVPVRDRRSFDDLVELRAEDGQPPRIVGNIIYNRWSQDLGGFVERLLPGVFRKTLLEGDIRSLFNHDPNIILGRNKADTLALDDQASGLRYQATPADTQSIRDLVLEPMRRKEVTGSSFGFRTITDAWREPTHPDNSHARQGLWERDLVEAQLYDVGPVTFPAYLQSDSAVRSMFEGGGVDFAVLSGILLRAERGITLTDADVDLLNGSIDVLRSYIPSPPESDEGHHADEPQAGRDVAHLRRLLDLREREFSQVI
jgi:hypothetical protein